MRTSTGAVRSTRRGAAGTSLWSMVADPELESALQRIRALDEAGTLEAFVAEQDRERPFVGQVGFHFAVRAQAP